MLQMGTRRFIDGSARRCWLMRWASRGGCTMVCASVNLMAVVQQRTWGGETASLLCNRSRAQGLFNRLSKQRIASEACGFAYILKLGAACTPCTYVLDAQAAIRYLDFTFVVGRSIQRASPDSARKQSIRPFCMFSDDANLQRAQLRHLLTH